MSVNQSELLDLLCTRLRLRFFFAKAVTLRLRLILADHAQWGEDEAVE